MDSVDSAACRTTRGRERPASASMHRATELPAGKSSRRALIGELRSETLLISDAIFLARAARILCGKSRPEKPDPRGGTEARGRGGVAVRLLYYLLGEPGSIPGEVAPGFSHVEIVLDDATGRGFSRDLPFPHALAFRRSSILLSLHPHRLSSN
ncbi:hypothetical protein PR048_024706 [Dryococelus australis]|uniref:Uncharacterized protein n=1 Tax=Dryococelus australis TaxID=614101 RepID=A0ABQ9GPB3_9NEOP|nr:hypothetical protein PR048_024706 [Dryococelus australis]